MDCSTPRLAPGESFPRGAPCRRRIREQPARIQGAKCVCHGANSLINVVPVLGKRPPAALPLPVYLPSP